MRVVVFSVLASLVTAAAFAQQPPASAPAPAPAQAAAPTAAAPTPPATADPPAPVAEAYSYSPDGRRDPFLNLLARGGEPLRTGLKPEGVSGLLTADLSVRGVIQSRGGLIAMVQGPDRKTYTIKQGDALLDGVVKAVMTEGLVIVQDVNDPLSLVKQREVRKLLRSVEDPK